MRQPFFWSWSKQKSFSARSVKLSDDCSIELSDGRRVLDGMSSNFQAGFGHSCKKIKDAISRQLNEFPVAGPKFSFDLKSRVSLALLNLVDRGSGRIFYTLSGAESVENALKMARQISGKNIVCARRKSYHGATMGAMSVTGDWRGQGHFGVSEQTIRLPEPTDDPDLSKTRALLKAVGPENIAAFCLETISGMNGVIIPPKNWWMGISQICRENRIFLIIDEVSTGFGRTGPAFAFHHYGIEPDFVCMAKAISGGYIPFGALWVKEQIAAYYDDEILNAGLTAYAHPLGLAACEAVLDIWNDASFQQQKKHLEECFASELARIEKLSAVKDVRSIGLIAAIELKDGACKTWDQFIDAGAHVALKENTVILAPPMLMETSDLTKLMKIVSDVISK